MRRAHPVRLSTTGNEFCVGTSNRQHVRDHLPPATVLRSVNSKSECPVSDQLIINHAATVLADYFPAKALLIFPIKPVGNVVFRSEDGQHE